jgi:hypothetical protein
MRGEIVGGISNPVVPSGVDQESSLRFLGLYARALARAMPVLGEVKILRQWAGCYDLTPDGNPLVGDIDAVPGLYLLSGFMGHGFMMAPIMGELFAHEVKVGPQLDTRLGAVPVRSRSSTGEVEAPSLSLPGATERLSVGTAVSDTATTGTLSAPPPRSNLGWVALAAGLGLCTLAGMVATWAVLAPSPVAPHVVAPAAATARPEAQAAAAYATLYVESTPAGAEVELSGRGVIGRTPMEIALLPPGTQIVRLRADGFSPWERALPLRENERAHVSAELVRFSVDGVRRLVCVEEFVGVIFFIVV